MRSFSQIFDCRHFGLRFTQLGNDGKFLSTDCPGSASLHQCICALQIPANSPIPAGPPQPPRDERYVWHFRLMNKTPSVPRAALWMAGWLALMLIVTVAGRETLRELNVFQVMEVRSIVGLLILVPMIRSQGGLAAMRTSRPLQHIGRNLVHYAAQIGWFFALTLIPLAQVVSIEFTMPIWTAILAVSFLGERMTFGKVAAILLGIVGVIVIVRPVAGEINPGQLIALGAAVGFGVSIAMMKSLTRTEKTLAIIFWMLVIQSAAGFFPALYVWQWPSAYAWGWMAVLGFSGTFTHYCMARAMLYADATVVLPLDFLRVPLTAIMGWLIYSERLDMFAVLGAALILTGNLLNLRSAQPLPARAGA
jgi:drug/metabolite transporter (DMT)-like permease